MRFDHNVGLYLCYKSATRVSATQIDIEWLDHANFEGWFDIMRRRLGSSSPYILRASVVENVPTFSDTMVDAASGWEYLVVARNAQGDLFQGQTLCSP